MSDLLPESLWVRLYRAELAKDIPIPGFKDRTAGDTGWAKIVWKSGLREEIHQATFYPDSGEFGISNLRQGDLNVDPVKPIAVLYVLDKRHEHAADIRKAKAEAWSEGVEAMANAAERDLPRPTNPYQERQ